MFRRLVVEGFRAFRDRVEVPLKSITVVTGRNNTGKSSLLEALAIASSALNGFRDGLGRNVLRQIVQSKNLDWNLLINAGSQRTAIVLETPVNSVNVEIENLERLDVEQIKPLALDALARTLSSKAEMHGLMSELRRLLMKLHTEFLNILESERMLKYLEMFLPTIIALLPPITSSTARGTTTDVAEALCNTLALEPDEKRACLAKIDNIVENLMVNYRKVLDNLVEWYLRRALKIVMKVSLVSQADAYASYTGTYLETEEVDPSSIQEFVEENLAFVEELGRSFMKMLAMIATLSGSEDAGRFFKQLIVVGKAHVVARALLHVVLEGLNKSVRELSRESMIRLAKVSREFSKGMTMVFLMHRDLWRWGDVGEMLDKVFVRGRGKLFNELLASLGVENVWRKREGVLLVTVGGKTLPLEAMGDGFVNMVRLAASHSFVEHGVVIVEEPETAMHPGYLALYAKMLIDFVANGARQVVLSTHSLELIDYVLEFAKRRDLLDRVNVVLLRRYDEQIELMLYDGVDAYNRRVEIREELRGL